MEGTWLVSLMLSLSKSNEKWQSYVENRVKSDNVWKTLGSKDSLVPFFLNLNINIFQKTDNLKYTCSLVPFSILHVSKIVTKEKNDTWNIHVPLLLFLLCTSKSVTKTEKSEIFVFACSLFYLFIFSICSFNFFNTKCASLFWKQQLCHVFLCIYRQYRKGVKS